MTDKEKRMLAIGSVGLAGVVLFQRMHSGAATRRAQTVPVTTTGSVQPYTPQAPLPLQPGESVYDPNNEALLTTPAGFNTANGDAGPGNQTTAPAAPSYTVNVKYPTSVKPVKHHKKPTKRPVKRTKRKVNK